MPLQSAPYHHDVAEGPEASAYWITADDGVRLRFAFWPKEAAKGTVLLFPGRTEYIEKYGRAAQDFAARGFAMVAIDWRGQGLADRLVKPDYAGYVTNFADYQRDVAAVMAALQDLDLPKPLYLLGHSMGGCIGLRALMGDLPVAAVAFSAPMWGIGMSTALRPAAWVLSSLSIPLGFGTKLAPGTSATTYVLDQNFEGNDLTKDADMYAYMQRQMRSYPALSLAGPSLHWLNVALKECRELRTQASPDIPCLTFLGTDEAIVDTQDIHDRMARWPNGTLDMIANGEHEVMMEVPQTRRHVFDAAAEFFASHT
ncbi:alpha/beta hydrolase [Shimia sp. R11_0]|uniref:alpha/beta hydrolase n=1 Tax=Shimia sp. R11_0 TaxID=2821096 RepID=UPI001ADA10EB|nr:alpha/beta hydrolase [Shimia sp. R11_0]MBO9479114.1 alpha/beta hydrolase [Shimia sp. R11_0]